MKFLDYLMIICVVLLLGFIFFSFVQKDSDCRKMGGVPVGRTHDCWVEGRGFVDTEK